MVIPSALATLLLVLIVSLFENRQNKNSPQERIKEEIESDPLEQLKNEFAEPEVLARNRKKDQMIELAKTFRIKVDKKDTKADIARKIFDVKNSSIEKLKKKLNQ
jgi:hypothetical protein